MERTSKIYLAGHRGLVGSAIFRQLQEKDLKNIVTRSSRNLDLRNQAEIAGLFTQEKPDYVFWPPRRLGEYWPIAQLF